MLKKTLIFVCYNALLKFIWHAVRFLKTPLTIFCNMRTQQSARTIGDNDRIRNVEWIIRTHKKYGRDNKQNCCHSQNVNFLYVINLKIQFLGF